MSKPLEYWIALAAASLYVFNRSSDKPLINRTVMTGISAALGYSTTPDLAAMAGRPELLTMVVVTTTVYLVLDFISALFADRSTLIDLIKRFVKK